MGSSAPRAADPVAGPASVYDGVPIGELADTLGVPAVVAYAAVPSTLDVAHDLAARGAAAGTLVLADEQTAGRGRGGRSWTSRAGQGVWLTLVERPSDVAALGVLSLRLGLAAAEALEPLAAAPLEVKWPNDVHVGRRKLAGILVEARWREGAPEWAAVGMGVNVSAPPEVSTGGGLRPGVRRRDVLAALVPALRRAVGVTGALRAAEREAFDRRHVAHGRRCAEPAVGRVLGISADGALRVDTGHGVRECATGSLVLEEAP